MPKKTGGIIHQTLTQNRNRGETSMGCWKAVIWLKSKARHFENQKTEVKIGVRILNRMTGLGRPRFERTV